MELWSLLYFLMPAGVQAEGTGFANHKEFSEWFSSESSLLPRLVLYLSRKNLI